MMKHRTWSALLAAALASTPAPAATFFVTSTADDGVGSLRAAILNANASGTALHTLLLDMPPNRVISLKSDLPAISARQLIIDGAGAPNVSIRAPDSGILTIGSDNRLFVLRNLSLGPSRARHSGGCLWGPAVAANANRNVLVTDVQFTQCRAQPAEPGTLAGASGGAIDLQNRGLVLTRGLFRNNSVGAPAGFGRYSAAGGAIGIGGAASLRTIISDSVFIDNVVVGVAGGGISSRGGAVASFGQQLLVSDSTFRGNQTGGVDGVAGHIWVSGNSVIENSVFQEGSSDRGAVVATAEGWDDTFALYNNTFHHVDGGTGAAVESSVRTTILRNNSFAGTESSDPMAIDLDVQNVNAVGMQLRMSHNAFQARYPGTLRPVCRADGALLESNWNLSDRENTGCGIEVVAAGSLLLQPPMMVADRLVPVAPLAGSTAIDAGNPASPAGGSDTCMPNDAIGYRRPQDGDGDGEAVCDIGAMETAPDAVFADGFEP